MELLRGSRNTYGNAFVKKETDLLTESQGQRMVDASKARFWKVKNVTKKNSVTGAHLKDQYTCTRKCSQRCCSVGFSLLDSKEKLIYLSLSQEVRPHLQARKQKMLSAAIQFVCIELPAPSDSVCLRNSKHGSRQGHRGALETRPNWKSTTSDRAFLAQATCQRPSSPSSSLMAALLP